MKKILALLLACSLVLLTACGAQGGSSSSGSSSGSGTQSDISASGTEGQTPDQTMPEGLEPIVLKQFAEPEAGTPIATIKTNMGEIKIMLFPNEAPKAVENFIALSEKGYYNGVTFHRVVKDFMIQGGDPKGTGTGGESMWGKAFEDEFSDSLYNFRGSISMANGGFGTNGSQFFINQNAEKYTTEQYKKMAVDNIYFNKVVYEHNLKLYTAMAGGLSEDDINKLIDDANADINARVEQGVPTWATDRLNPVMAKYNEVGGNPSLDYKHTVFGQVIEGMDIVDKIADVKVETDAAAGKDNRPVDPIIIESITITTAK